MNIKKKPQFLSVPNFRNYEDYHDAEQYVRGWNDAMRFIFEIEESNNHCQCILNYMKKEVDREYKESKAKRDKIYALIQEVKDNETHN